MDNRDHRMHMLKTNSFLSSEQKSLKPDKDKLRRTFNLFSVQRMPLGPQNAPILSFVTNEWMIDQKKSFELFTIIKLKSVC